jgi:hypothetical protein
MYPPLLKSIAGRSKNRHKGALEGGSRKKIKRHECPICHQLGHHWYTYKNGDPTDIAANGNGKVDIMTCFIKLFKHIVIWTNFCLMLPAGVSQRRGKIKQL